MRLSFGASNRAKNKPISYTNLVAIAAYNLTILVIGLSENWQIKDVILIFWLQSVLLGLFYYIRLAATRRLDVKGANLNSRQIDSSKSSVMLFASVSLFTYLLFHFIYLMMINQTISVELSYFNNSYFQLSLASIIVGQGFILLRQMYRDTQDTPILSNVVTGLYNRVWPMHLFIVLGGLVIGDFLGLITFMILKTLLDIVGEKFSN